VICGRSHYYEEAAKEKGTYQRKGAVDRLEQATHPESCGIGSPAFARPLEIRVECVSNLGFSHNPARKLLSYATFYVGALWKALRGPKPDVVMTLTAPPGLAWIGWLLKRVSRCRYVTWEMDVYPDIAVALGMPVIGRLGWLLDYPRRRADAVIALGDCMRDLLLRHGIPETKIHVAENWAHGLTAQPSPSTDRPLRILYSGHFGLAHDLATIREAIVRLADDARFHFDFVGGGPQRKKLLEFCLKRTIQNVSFRQYVPRDKLGASLAEGHIGLVTQKPATLGAVVPSKTYGLMAAGRPILYIGPAAATPALVIRRFDCGWCLECGDTDGVLSLLERLARFPGEIEEKGQRARQAFAEHYDMPAGVGRICRVLGFELSSPGPAQPDSLMTATPEVSKCSTGNSSNPR
jgi:glycosyltransferase involved in cell wall biosynthesis